MHARQHKVRWLISLLPMVMVGALGLAAVVLLTAVPPTVGAPVVDPSTLLALSSGDYFLHTAGSDILDRASPTASTAKFMEVWHHD